MDLDWYAVKLKPKGLSFFSESFYIGNAEKAEDVLVFICSLKSVSDNTARILICNEMNGMIRQLAPYAAVDCFNLIRKATKEETVKLDNFVTKRKLDINAPLPRRKTYVRNPTSTVSEAV